MTGYILRGLIPRPADKQRIKLPAFTNKCKGFVMVIRKNDVLTEIFTTEEQSRNMFRLQHSVDAMLEADCEVYLNLNVMLTNFPESMWKKIEQYIRQEYETAGWDVEINKDAEQWWLNIT